MKKITSKIAIILSVIFFVLSICPITSMELLKGKVLLQDTIINSTDIIYDISNMSYLPNKQIALFYIGLALVIISSIVCFEKSNKFKGLLDVILSIITVLFVIITHNYIWFLILMNLCLVTNLIIDFTLKDKVIIAGNIIGFMVAVLNLIQLIQHLQLTFDPVDIQTFQTELVKLSDSTLRIFALWLIPYTILLIKNIIATYKLSRTVK